MDVAGKENNTTLNFVTTQLPLVTLIKSDYIQLADAKMTALFAELQICQNVGRLYFRTKLWVDVLQLLLPQIS